jgi:hypothetical protein
MHGALTAGTAGSQSEAPGLSKAWPLRWRGARPGRVDANERTSAEGRRGANLKNRARDAEGLADLR